MSCVHKDIPAFHYMIAVGGGESIRCSPYALFGSQELSRHAIAALENRKACLLGNHGMIALGKDLNRALALTVEVESLCEQYMIALQLGTPRLLNSSQMKDVLLSFQNYGQFNT